MKDFANRKIQKFIRENHLFPEIEEWEEPDDADRGLPVDDFLYAEFYLMKKLSAKYGFNLNKIKNSSSLDEYEKNIEDELIKIHGLNSDGKEWFWKRLYENRVKVFDFIENLNLEDFDITIQSDVWLADDYLTQFIDLPYTYFVLSVFTTFYDKFLSKTCNIDVIYNEFQLGNVIGHKARLDMVDNHNYNFINDTFPKTFDKKYDLIILNLDYSSKDALDKKGILSYDDRVGGFFKGDCVSTNIANVVMNLSSNGIAIIKTPFTFISKIDDELIDSNIIDKIIYLPKEIESFAFECLEVKNVYVIVRKNKLNDEIEFIDKETCERCSVKNELIKKHNGCTNMHIYNKHNPMLEKLYKIKKENDIQLEIISKESEFIDKQIDELDFE